MRYTTIRILFFWLFALTATAQKVSKVEIVHADELGFDKAARGNITVFKGNCLFKQDDMTVACDSAFFDQDQNAFDAFGHVHIIQQNLNIYGDLLNYDGNIKFAQLFNNIKATDGEMVLTTNNMTYDMKQRLATYYDGGKIVDHDNVMTSRLGYYYANTKDAYFRQRVVLVNPDYLMNSDTMRYNTRSELAYLLGPSRIESADDCLYGNYGIYNTQTSEAFCTNGGKYENSTQQLIGDTLYYNKDKGLGKANGHVFFIDTVQDLLLTGGVGNYNKNIETTYLTKFPLMILVTEKDSGGTDSLYLTADTLLTNFDSAKINRQIRAFHDVRMYKSDLQARCDSMFYSNADSLMRCYKNPIAWANKAQMTADFISLQLKNGQLDKLNMRNSSFIISPEDTFNFNQVKGKNMTGFFVNSSLHHMLVEGNGQSIYFARQDSSGQYIGMNNAECSNMLIQFRENKAQSITFITKPDATFFPMDQLPSQQRLKGFKWQARLQPKSKEDLFKKDF